MAISDSQWFPKKLCLIKISMFIFSFVDSLQNSLAHFYCWKIYRNYKNSTLKNLEKKTISGLDNGFQGTVVNRALPSLHGGSLDLT